MIYNKDGANLNAFLKLNFVAKAKLFRKQKKLNVRQIIVMFQMSNKISI